MTEWSDHTGRLLMGENLARRILEIKGKLESSIHIQSFVCTGRAPSLAVTSYKSFGICSCRHLGNGKLVWYIQ